MRRVGKLCLAVVAAGLISGELQATFSPPAVLLWHRDWLYPWGAPTSGLEILGVGDLSGDGLEDILISDYQSVRLFEAQADGTLRDKVVGFYEIKWHDGKYYTVVGRVHPTCGTLADLDGDRDLDLVVGTGGKERALYLFSNTGRGELQKKVTIPIVDLPYKIWIADLNKDGVPDLLWWTVNEKDAGFFYLHLGLSPFKFAEGVLLFSAVGRAFALADLDGDGFLDLALHRKNGLLILLVGREGIRETWEWESGYGEVQHAALGKDGLLVLATDQGFLSGRFSQEGFEVEQFLDLGPLSWVHLGDLTERGFEDALVRGGIGWMVLPRKDASTFHTPTSEFLFFGILSLGPGDSFWSLTLGGRPVLVVPSEPLPSLYCVGGIPQGSTLIPFEGTYLLGVGDLNGDRAPELLVEGQQGLDVLWNDGGGAFIRKTFLKEPVRVMVAEVKAGQVWFLSVADRPEGWKATELWGLSAEGELLTREELEVFRPEKSNAVQPSLALADFDGDGELDVLVLRIRDVLVKWGGKDWTSYFWTAGDLGLATMGYFTQRELPEVALLSEAGLFYLSFPQRAMQVTQAPFELREFPLNMAAGDLDRDDLDDVVLLTMDLGVELKELDVQALLRGEGVKLIWRGVRGWIVLSSGELWDVSLPKLQEYEAFWPLKGLALGDYDGDGKIDLAFTTALGSGVYILLNYGDGAFDGLKIPRPIGPLFSSDLDGNGQHELVGSSLGFNPYLWIFWNGGRR